MKLGLFAASAAARSWLATSLLAAHPALQINQDIEAHDAGACDLALLMGLEASALDTSIELEDMQLRARLAKSGKAFHVLYGNKEARLQTAQSLLNLLSATLLVANNAYSLTASSTIVAEHQENWRWNCDKCSDPDCEHRLFTGLMKSGGPGLQTG